MDKVLAVDKVQQFVKKYFAAYHKPELCFHTFSRAKSVVKAAEKIATQYELSKEEYFVLMAAAWFYSIGYLTNKEDHQAAAAELAIKFLITKEVDLNQIDRITAIIMTPLQTDDAEDIVIRILLDAIFYYLGAESFLKKIEQQRKSNNGYQKQRSIKRIGCAKAING